MSETEIDRPNHRVCMIVQQRDVKGGIAAVTEGYYGSRLCSDYDITFIESYCDGSKFAKLKKVMKAYRQFNRLLNSDNRPELVHMHTSFGPSFYRSVLFINKAASAGIPIVNHIHGADFDEFYRNASENKKKKIRKIYGKCDEIVTLSDEWKDMIAETTDADKIHVICNYSMPQAKEEIEHIAEKRYNDHQVLFLGEIGKRKGAYDLPDIITAVCEKDPNVEFVIAGEGSAKEDVQRLIQKSYIDNVRFPGWVRGAEKKKLLMESSVYFLPSYQEGMPMSILDAMGYGLPVVSTDIGGIPQIVRNSDDGENGILCRPGDKDAMADALLSYLTDEKLQHAAGVKSLEIVKNEYSLEKHIDKIEDVYSKLLVDV